MKGQIFEDDKGMYELWSVVVGSLLVALKIFKWSGSL